MQQPEWQGRGENILYLKVSHPGATDSVFHGYIHVSIGDSQHQVQSTLEPRRLAKQLASMYLQPLKISKLPAATSELRLLPTTFVTASPPA